MLLEIVVHKLSRISLLRWLTRALSLSTITIVTDKGSFSRDQAYIKKREDRDWPSPKLKKSRPARQTNNFLSPALLKDYCQILVLMYRKFKQTN